MLCNKISFIAICNKFTKFYYYILQCVINSWNSTTTHSNKFWFENIHLQTTYKSLGKFKSIFIIHNIAINFNKVGLVFLNYHKNNGFYTQFCFLSNIWNFQPVSDFRFLMVVAYLWIKISTVTYFWLVYLVENNQQFLFFQQIPRQFLNSSKNITCL